MLKSRLLKMCPRMMQPSLVTIAMSFIPQGTIGIFATTKKLEVGVGSKSHCVLKIQDFQGILL
jgi:hypothetical protein